MLNFKRVFADVKSSILGAVGIVALALFLRTYNIYSIPIFVDEAIYIRWAQVMKSVPSLRFLPLTDGKQPLFMWATIPFMKVFEDPLVAARFVSAVCGIGSAVGIGLLTYVLFRSRKTALWASFLYAISPFTVFYDRMALVDSMLSMFGIWSMFFAVLTAKYLRLDTAMLAGFSLGFAWLTKSPALFFILLLPSTVFLAGLPKKVIGLKFLKLCSLWMVAGFIGFAIYNILRLGPTFHMIAARNQDYVFPLSHFLTSPFAPFEFHIRETLGWFLRLLPGNILIAASLAVFLGRKKYWREILFLGAWFLFPLAVQAELAKVFTGRYVLFTLPPLFILSALTLTQLIKFQTRTYWVVVGLMVVPALYINYLFLVSPEKAPLSKGERGGYLEAWTSGTGIREVAQFIKDEKVREPNKTIIVGTEGFFGTLPDGLQIYVSDIPGVVVKGVGIKIVEVDSSLIQAKRTGDKVYLVVNSSRFQGDPADIGLKLVSAYPKAIASNGKRESLLLFEVTDRAVEVFEIKKNAEEN